MYIIIVIDVPLLLIANAVFMAVSGIDEVFLHNSHHSSSHVCMGALQPEAVSQHRY